MLESPLTALCLYGAGAFACLTTGALYVATVLKAEVHALPAGSTQKRGEWRRPP